MINRLKKILWTLHINKSNLINLKIMINKSKIYKKMKNQKKLKMNKNKILLNRFKH